MEFSFNGTLDELKELGLLISGSQVASVEVPIIVDTKELTDSAEEEMDLELQTPSNDAPQISIGESIAKKPYIDPATGDYFTAFKDMVSACDRLTCNGQQSEVKALLETNSSDGTYGGIPPKAWKSVEDEAKALLKSKKETAVTLGQLKELATEYTHADPKANKPKLKELLGKYGAKGISTISEEKRSAFYDELNALHKGE